jgi:8-oxo-dGTP pyrophosphatase MutT (NUDIX family)
MFQQEIDRKNGYRPGVGIILIHDGRVMLGSGVSFWNSFRFEGEGIVFEQYDNWKYAWDMPQGGIEVGESFGQTIRREIEEELGSDWAIETPRQFRREQLDFPVRKDGRTYKGKTYYYHYMEVVGFPEGFDDWVFGPRGDEEPSMYPTPAFPGGVMFLEHRAARSVVIRSRSGRKGQLVLSILDELRHRRMIRA